MHLRIDTMDSVLVEYSPDGRVRLDREDWTRPTRQEIRAIIHAAETEMGRLAELVETLKAVAR